MDEINYEKWIKLYKPIKNHLNENASVDGYLFMHYGPEWDFVCEFRCKKVWSFIITDLDDDTSSLGIINGIRVVNREGYFVTEKSYTEERPLVINY